MTALNHDEYEAALRKADQILQVAPRHYRALNTKGSVYFYQGDFREAAGYFEAAHKQNSDSANITMNLADAYVELGWYDEAVRTYDSVRSSSPEWWYAQGRAYLFAGRYQDAERLLALVPTNFNRGTARILRAAALAALSAPDAATELRVGLDQDPVYWEAVLSGRRVEKRESYNKVAKLLEVIRVPTK